MLPDELPPPEDDADNRWKNRANPLPMASGTNPFAGENQSPDGNENPYHGSTAAPQPLPTEAYSATLAPRGKQVLTIACAGVALWFGMNGMVLANVFGFQMLETLFQRTDPTPLMCALLPFSVCSLALFLPAWRMAANDLNAIRAGALDGTDRRKITAAYIIGLIGTVVAATPVVWLIGIVIVALITHQWPEW